MTGYRKRLSLGIVSAGHGRFANGGVFLSVSLSVKGNEDGCFGDSGNVLGQNGDSEEVTVVEQEQEKLGSGALNTTKHLWSGAVAAMVSR